MNAQRMINMALRLLMRHGTDYLARRGKAPDTMTAEDKAQARSARDLGRKAGQAARLTRRIGRF